MKGARWVPGLAKIVFHLPNVSFSTKEDPESGDLENQVGDGPWAKPGKEEVWKPWLRLGELLLEEFVFENE
jgi:hypothetical protein